MLFLHEPNHCYARESTPLLVLQLGRAWGARARARGARARPPRSVVCILHILSLVSSDVTDTVCYRRATSVTL